VNFSELANVIEESQIAKRKSWIEEDKWMTIVPATYVPLDLPTLFTPNSVESIGDNFVNLKHVTAWFIDGKWQPGWIPDQEDLLADDWEIFS